MKQPKVMNPIRLLVLSFKKNVVPYRNASVTIVTGFIVLFVFLFISETTTVNQTYRHINLPANQLIMKVPDVSDTSMDAIQSKKLISDLLVKFNAQQTITTTEASKTYRHTTSTLIFVEHFVDIEFLSAARTNSLTSGSDVIMMNLIEGERFNQINSKQTSIIIGEEAKTALFGQQNAVGQSILIPLNGVEVPFTVIGVVQTKALPTSRNSRLISSFQYVDVYLPKEHVLLANSDQEIEYCFMFDTDDYASVKSTNQKFISYDTNKLIAVAKMRVKTNTEQLFTSFIIILLIIQMNIYSSLSNVLNEREHEFETRFAIGASIPQIFLLVFLETSIIHLVCVILALLLSYTLISVYSIGVIITGGFFIPLITTPAINLITCILLSQSIVFGVIFGVIQSNKLTFKSLFETP